MFARETELQTRLFVVSGELSRFEGPEARAARGAFQLGTRLLVYAVAATVILAGVLQAMRSFGLPIATREGGLVQSVQLILLVASSLILLLVSSRRSTVVFRFLAFLPIMAATREMDSVLETYLFDESHTLGLVIISVVALTYVMRHRREFLRQLESVLSCRSFGLLFAGVVLVLVVSRLMGQQVVWEAALGETYLRSIPRAIEEIGELIGYLVLTLGAIEAWFEPRDLN